MNTMQEEQKASSFLTSLYCEYRNLMLSIAQTYINDTQACEGSPLFPAQPLILKTVTA